MGRALWPMLIERLSPAEERVTALCTPEPSLSEKCLRQVKGASEVRALASLSLRHRAQRY